MANFETELSAPQGAGTSPVAPVQQKNTHVSLFSMANDAMGVFADEMKKKSQRDEMSLKKTVIGEYTNAEKTYSDALVSGQWNASHAAAASRAKFMQMLASYPEYANDLMNARSAVYNGTEMGEAQKKIDREEAMKLDLKKAAMNQGFTFYSGMSKEAEDAIIEASQAGIRQRQWMDDYTKRKAEERAQSGEQRAQQSHTMSVQDWRDKEDASKHLLTIADKNFDSFRAITNDLFNRKDMPFEQKQMILMDNVQRIHAGITAVAVKNPALAEPFKQLFQGISDTALKMLDPNLRDANELKRLQDQYNTMLYKAKIAAISDPKALKAVVATQLFNDPAIVQEFSGPIVSNWLSSAGMGDEYGTPTQMIGTENEKPTLNTLSSALKNLSAGKVQDKEKATQEAVNAVNAVLRQTAMFKNGAKPEDLKSLATFYASAEFGKLAESGALNKETVENVKRTFQTAYEPAVRDAVLNRLDGTHQTADGSVHKIIDKVRFNFSGAGVSMEYVDTPKDKMFPSTGDLRDQVIASELKKELKKASEGLNRIVYIGAHMEGTTNYKKYWEDNKHLILPGVFMKGLEPGTKINGFTFLGGDARNPKNYRKDKPESGTAKQ